VTDPFEFFTYFPRWKVISNGANSYHAIGFRSLKNRFEVDAAIGAGDERGAGFGHNFDHVGYFGPL
jgi:hypothetical protein